MRYNIMKFFGNSPAMLARERGRSFSCLCSSFSLPKPIPQSHLQFYKGPLLWPILSLCPILQKLIQIFSYKVLNPLSLCVGDHSHRHSPETQLAMPEKEAD